MSRQFRWVLVLSILGYLALLGISYLAGEAYARTQAEKTLDIADDQIRITMTESTDYILTFIGMSVVRSYGSPTNVTPERMAADMRSYAIDEMTFVDGKGRVVLSSDPRVHSGADFCPSSDARTVDYGALLRGKRSVVETLRRSLEQPNSLFKYGGVAFPDRDGFVQIGLESQRLISVFDYVYEDVAVDYRFGEYGYYVVADPMTGKIVSTFSSEGHGKNLKQVVPELDCRERCSGTRRLTVFGEPCCVHEMTSNGFRILSVLPERELSAFRNVVVAVTATVLLVVIFVFVLFFCTIEARNRAAQRLLEVKHAQAQKDLLMAKDIQQNAMPTVFPPYPLLVDKFDVFAFMRTAKEVGGDFYDFYFTGPNQLGVMIADVSGKGIPAAMFMMRAKTTLQGLLRGGGDVAEAVSEVNARLSSGNEANMFVTAWVGVVNLETGHVEYVNAGHNPPLLERADGAVEWIRPRSGPPLAAVEGVRYKKQSFDLGAGDGLFLYTDGVTEAMTQGGELFGESRLMSVIKPVSKSGEQAVFHSAQDICGLVMAELDAFVAGAEQSDDITMLAFRLKCPRL